MNTDDLVKVIAEDGAAKPPSVPARVGVALAIGALVAGALFVQSLGVRPDVGEALQTWRFAAKVAIVLASFLTALWVTTRLSHPDAGQRRTLAVLSLPVLMLAFAIGWELATSPASSWSGRAIGSNSRLCLVSIALMAVAPLVTLLVALRAGAPQSPATAGAVAGLLAGSLAATLYAVLCVDDSPLFVALWYTLPVAAIALAGAAAGSRVLRW
jgi:hypothetical protein